MCSPAKAVRWQQTPKGLESRLNGVLIDRYADGENAGYPTLCKGRFDVGDDENYYAIEEPTSLNTLELPPQLMKMGVRAIKIEGRQRSPAYVAQVTKTWREAIDHCIANPRRYAPKPAWMASLDKVAEGQQHTAGRLPQTLEMMTTPTLKIALGPLQYYWPRDTVFSFCTTCAGIVALFDAARRQALARMQPLMPGPGCNGYWHGHPGLEQGKAVAAA